MRGYDAWKTAEPFEDAPLHRHCLVCSAPTQSVHEEYAGLCRVHLAEDRIAMDESEGIEVEEAARC